MLAARSPFDHEPDIDAAVPGGADPPPARRLRPCRLARAPPPGHRAGRSSRRSPRAPRSAAATTCGRARTSTTLQRAQLTYEPGPRRAHPQLMVEWTSAARPYNAANSYCCFRGRGSLRRRSARSPFDSKHRPASHDRSDRPQCSFPMRAISAALRLAGARPVIVGVVRAGGRWRPRGRTSRPHGSPSGRSSNFVSVLPAASLRLAASPLALLGGGDPLRGHPAQWRC